jgi:hypothetical protein
MILNLKRQLEKLHFFIKLLLHVSRGMNVPLVRRRRRRSMVIRDINYLHLLGIAMGILLIVVKRLVVLFAED